MSYLFFLALYLWVSYALYRIARREGVPRAWFAALPIAREWLLVRTAGRSWRWFVLIMIPVANIIATWVVWGDVARKLGRSVWLGRTMLIPILNIFILAFLTFDLNIVKVRDLLRRIYSHSNTHA